MREDLARGFFAALNACWLACLARVVELLRRDAAALRAHVASWIHDAATRTDPATAVPAFIKNKLAQVCARLAGAEYPARWPSFFADLLQLAANAGDGGLDALVRVLDAVDDEVISSGALGEAVTRNFMRQILAGVEHCHARGVAHRDLGQHAAAVNKVRSGWAVGIGVTSVLAH